MKTHEIGGRNEAGFASTAHCLPGTRFVRERLLRGKYVVNPATYNADFSYELYGYQQVFTWRFIASKVLAALDFV